MQGLNHRVSTSPAFQKTLALPPSTYRAKRTQRQPGLTLDASRKCPVSRVHKPPPTPGGKDELFTLGWEAAPEPPSPLRNPNIYHCADLIVAGAGPGKGQAPWWVLAQRRWAAWWGITAHLCPYPSLLPATDLRGLGFLFCFSFPFVLL